MGFLRLRAAENFLDHAAGLVQEMWRGKNGDVMAITAYAMLSEGEEGWC